MSSKVVVTKIVTVVWAEGRAFRPGSEAELNAVGLQTARLRALAARGAIRIADEPIARQRPKARVAKKAKSTPAPAPEKAEAGD